MDPYQQYQAPSSGGQDDFIMNPGKPPRKKLFAGNNFAMTLALIVGGAFIFMIIVAMLLNAFAPKKVSKADLISLAQTQQEIVRVATRANQDAVQQVTKNLAVTVQYTLTSQQQTVVNYLAKNGTKVSPKQLALKQNATTDQQLTSATSTSTFDLVFSQIMQNELQAYANSLKALNAKAASTTEQNFTSAYYQQTQLLISQIPYTQNSIQNVGQQQVSQ